MVDVLYGLQPPVIVDGFGMVLIQDERMKPYPVMKPWHLGSLQASASSCSLESCPLPVHISCSPASSSSARSWGIYTVTHTLSC